LLRRIGDHVDVVTYLGEYFRTRLAGALSPEAADRMVRLAPGVDTSAFRPGAGGAAIRARLGLGRRPVVICVSRMVPRKGQDTLIRAWPRVLAATTRPGSPGPLRTAAGAEAEGAGAAAADAAEAPGVAAGRAGDPVLLLVGDGPYRADLVRLAERSGVSRSVVFAGPVPWEELPAYYDAGDVFAMPCRTRRRGLDVEGLGIVYLEASATGLPVIGGDSGGAPDAILDGETGFVVPGRSVAAVADRVIGLLGDPAAARAMGERGVAWVDHEWRWDLVADRLTKILSG
jgi:phosphatidylinositol alpha-1,6-mannosyltransferase